MNIEFEQLNIDWNADPNVPEVSITVSGYDVEVSFFLNAFQSGSCSENDKAKLVFHDCLQYRYGSPNDHFWSCGAWRAYRQPTGFSYCTVQTMLVVLLGIWAWLSLSFTVRGSSRTEQTDFSRRGAEFTE